MRLLPSLLTSTAAIAIALPAAADVTPEEVWAMFSEVTEATGATVTADQSRDGDALTLDNIAATWTLPMGFGEFSLRTSGYVLTDLGDGTVSFAAMGDKMTVAFAGRIAIEGEEVAATGTIDLDMPGSETVISGTADDMTATGTAPMTTFTLTSLDLTLPEGEDLGFDPASIVAEVTVADAAQTVRYVREADVFRVTSESTNGATASRFSIPMEFNGMSENFGSTDSGRNTSTVVLPRGEMSVMNLAAAIRAGLRAEGTGSATNSVSGATTTMDGGQILTSQQSVTTAQDSTFSFGEDGLRIDGTASGISLDFAAPELFPMQIAGQLAEARAQFVLPVLATPDTAQPVEYDIAMTGLTLNEEIWSLFDPAQMLPRDPITLVIDLGAEVRPLVDLLDVETMIAMIQRQETPVELDSIRIDELRLSAAGAEVQGDGAFTLDFTDMTTFPGAPRPEGSATVRIAGANQLMDTLVQMGLLGEQDIMGARMGLGMFTRPVSDDLLESQVEINEQGQVFVNDQRMR